MTIIKIFPFQFILDCKNNYISKPRVINLGKKYNKENGVKNKLNNQKKIIESYKTKNPDIQYMKKTINFEPNITNDKKYNLSLFSSLNVTLSQEEKLTNKSFKITNQTKVYKLNNNMTNKNKYIINSDDSKLHNIDKKKKKIFNLNKNCISLNKELDKLEKRIYNIMEVIDNFEKTYLYPPRNAEIKEEFNQLIQDKKYLNRKKYGFLNLYFHQNNLHYLHLYLHYH